MPNAGRPDGGEVAAAGRAGGLRLLLVAPPDGAEAWVASLAEAGLEPRAGRCESAAALPAALEDPFDLVLAWDDEAGARGAAVAAAAGTVLPVAVVAHPAAEAGALRALGVGAASVVDGDRPARLAAQAERILEGEWLAVRSDLSGRVAHDLNNLLAPIPLAVRLLQGAADPAATQGPLDSVQVAARRSMDAVKELSELLTAPPGLPLRTRAKHLLVLASRAWRRHPETAPTVLTDYPPDLGSVWVEPVRVLRVLDALARRALRRAGGADAGAAGLLFLGRAVGRGPAGEGAGVEVRVVAGAGGEFAVRELDPARSPEPGEGLEAVLELASAHGWVLSVLEAGSERAGFALLLPSADPPGASASDRPAPASARNVPSEGASSRGQRTAGRVDPSAADGTGRRILVIDGDAEVRRMTREILTGAGWEVVTAADGTEGVAVYAEHQDGVAAVLVDMALPYMDGPATIRALRRIGGASTFVLTTSGDGDPGRLTRREDGPDAVLRKPYDADALLRAVAAEEAPRKP